MNMPSRARPHLAAAALCVATIATPAFAQYEDKWVFDAIIYAYLPDIGGRSSFPARVGGTSINVGIGTILDNLNFTFMGTLEARKGRWGMFTDVLYLDVDGSESATRDFSIAHGSVPGHVTADFNLDVKGLIWTFAGTYRVSSDPALTADVVFGARLLDLDQTLGYDFSADLGPITGAGLSGSADLDITRWDAVVGIKGRYRFGENKEWFVPYYVDVGGGESKLTWQAFTGIGYTFSWGSVLGGWRYLDYEFKSSSKVEELDFNGPMLGVAFTW